MPPKQITLQNQETNAIFDPYSKSDCDTINFDKDSLTPLLPYILPNITKPTLLSPIYNKSPLPLNIIHKNLLSLGFKTPVIEYAISSLFGFSALESCMDNDFQVVTNKLINGELTRCLYKCLEFIFANNDPSQIPIALGGTMDVEVSVKNTSVTVDKKAFIKNMKAEAVEQKKANLSALDPVTVKENLLKASYPYSLVISVVKSLEKLTSFEQVQLLTAKQDMPPCLEKISQTNGKALNIAMSQRTRPKDLFNGMTSDDYIDDELMIISGVTPGNPKSKVILNLLKDGSDPIVKMDGQVYRHWKIAVNFAALSTFELASRDFISKQDAGENPKWPFNGQGRKARKPMPREKWRDPNPQTIYLDAYFLTGNKGYPATLPYVCVQPNSMFNGREQRFIQYHVYQQIILASLAYNSGFVPFMQLIRFIEDDLRTIFEKFRLDILYDRWPSDELILYSPDKISSDDVEALVVDKQEEVKVADIKPKWTPSLTKRNIADIEQWRAKIKHASIETKDEAIQTKKLTDRLFKNFNNPTEEVLELLNAPHDPEIEAQRTALPVVSYKNEFLEVTDSSDVTIVIAETGSGKSTQLPAYLLDKLKSGEECSVLVTQPRRIAAVSLAERVSQELGSKCGSLVGYQVRGTSRLSNDTRLTYATEGIVLRKLVHGGLENYTHLILDEAHLRSVNMDFLLALLKNMLLLKSAPKVIIMSATISFDTFINYFADCGNVTTLNIPGRVFPVKNHYIEDIVQMLDYYPSEEFQMNSYDEEARNDKVVKRLAFNLVDLGNAGNKDAHIRTMHQDLTRDTINQRVAEHLFRLQNNTYLIEGLSKMNFEKVNTELIMRLIIHLSKKHRSILVFLPGIEEIKALMTSLEYDERTSSYVVLPLYGSLVPAAQMKVFRTYGNVKVVLATNVAETSITVPDVTAVIDTGREREIRYNPKLGAAGQKLQLCWCSQSSCTQRAGRAGRVREGECYRLYSQTMFEEFSAFSLPEISRIPLYDVLLQCYSMDLTSPEEFLSSCITPPSEKAISSALSVLTLCKAIENNKITSAGELLAKIPTDLFAARLVLLGWAHRCLGPAVALAAILCSREFTPPTEALTSADGAYSDEIAKLNTYLGQKRGLHKFIPVVRIQEIDAAAKQFISSLNEIGLINGTPSYYDFSASTTYNENAGSRKLLIHLLVQAYFPSIIFAGYDENRKLAIKSHNSTGFSFHMNSLVGASFHKKMVNRKYLVFTEALSTTKKYIRSATIASPFSLICTESTIDVKYYQSYIDVYNEIVNMRDFIKLTGKPYHLWLAKGVNKMSSNAIEKSMYSREPLSREYLKALLNYIDRK